MTSAQRLFELQQLDTELQNLLNTIDDTNYRLSVNQSLNTAINEFNTLQNRLSILQKKQKELDQDVASVAETVKKLKNKLYGGSIKNPKELMDIDQDLKGVQANLNNKEETLFDIMTEIEFISSTVNNQKQLVASIQTTWDSDKVNLSREKTEIEERITKLAHQRDNVAAEIDGQTLSLYNSIKVKRGIAVVRVEMGRCQGCRVNLSVSELKQARTGVIQCSSCGRILYAG